MRRLLTSVALLVMAAAVPARAETTLYEEGEVRLSLGGFARSFSAIQRVPVEGLGLQTQGTATSLVRAEWSAHLGSAVSIELHQRVGLRTSTSASALGAFGPGVGVSVVPQRSVDLNQAAIALPQLRVDHDIDRLAVRIYLDAVDLTVGRQAISWGSSTLFQVADLWTTFSPFELDTSQKRGIDAVRALWSPHPQLEVDAIVADRGRLEDTSAGARATLFLDGIDLYAAAAKHWDSAYAFAGASGELGSFKLRGEATLPYDLEEGAVRRPRATLGIDWFRSDLFVGLEAHYNGAGAEGAGSYLEHATTSEVLARGESYLLGRWYAGAVATWRPWEPLSLVGSVLANLEDPSANVSLAVAYAPVQAFQLTVGAFRGVGAAPLLDEGRLELRSELGSFGNLYYVELAAFF